MYTNVTVALFIIAQNNPKICQMMDEKLTAVHPYKRNSYDGHREVQRADACYNRYRDE